MQFNELILNTTEEALIFCNSIFYTAIIVPPRLNRRTFRGGSHLNHLKRLHNIRRTQRHRLQQRLRLQFRHFAVHFRLGGLHFRPWGDFIHLHPLQHRFREVLQGSHFDTHVFWAHQFGHLWIPQFRHCVQELLCAQKLLDSLSDETKQMVVKRMMTCREFIIGIWRDLSIVTFNLNAIVRDWSLYSAAACVQLRIPILFAIIIEECDSWVIYTRYSVENSESWFYNYFTKFK